MSQTKRIYDNELTNGSVVVQIPVLLNPKERTEEYAQIEREQTFNHAMEGLQRMKNLWTSGDGTKRAFAMRYCSEVQEWLNALYFDSDFLAFGSEPDEPDYNALAREMDDRMWEVFHD